MKKLLSIVLISTVLFTSCKKSNTTNPNAKSDIAVHFDNIAGSAELALNTTNYTNAVGETFKVTKFDYYISNIRLKKTDGSEYVVPQNESYFLVKESDATMQDLDLSGVPVGDYNAITFTLGVDSLKNCAPLSERTGVLDPAAGGLGMYWVWNSGYIFLKMEGTSPAIAGMSNAFQYHIGGFGGMTAPTINNIKTITLSFPAGNVAFVREGKVPEVHILADALKVLNGSTNISLAASPMVMFNPASVSIANNYQNMFTVDHVHND
ncbi:MAG: MbnP family protein [Ferruginibacter sp.]